jgi:Secretion system C-terminal sorting domain
MKKLLLLGLLIVMINCSYGQSRGIKYEYSVSNNSAFNDNVFTSIYNYDPYLNSYNYHSTTFEIGFNDNVIMHTPFVKIGNNYFSLLTRYDSYLCPLDTRRIPIPPPTNSLPPDPLENVAYNGTSKSDGGFALVTNKYPHILRNYDNLGNIIFSKIISCPPILGNSWPSNTIYESRAKLLANPYNDNLYLIFGLNDISVSGSTSTSASSPTIVVIEISPSGTLVNAFRLVIPLAPSNGGPFIQGYSDPLVSSDPLLHDFTIYNQDFIGDVKYVKGGNGPSSDRLWVALNMDYQGSLELDVSSQTILSPYYVQSSFFAGNHSLLGVALISPQGISTTNEVSVMLPSTNFSGNLPGAQLIIAKAATPALPAEMMAITYDSFVPTIYHFRDHISTIPFNKYRFPSSLSYLYGTMDLKNYQNNILFSVNEYFGTFNPNSLSINLRKQSTTNAQGLGYVDFITRDTNKLYIMYNNYFNASGGVNPSNVIIKESMPSFNSTCGSNFVGNHTATVSSPSYYPLQTAVYPLPGVIITKDISYVEYKGQDIVTFRNVCLTCPAINKSSDDSIEISENQDIVLHPNPAKNYFELTTELAIEKVEVYSMLGQLVKTFETQNQYSITDLSKGSYIIKITTSEETLNKTLIVE